MGRTAQGYRIRLHHSGIYHIRWISTRTGKRYDLSLGTRDPVEGASRAAERYREVCERELAEPEAPAGDDLALDDVLRDTWITAIRSQISAGMPATLRIYWRHWAKHFATLGGITTATIATYQAARLDVVVKATVRKEVSSLRGFLRWCLQIGILLALPTVPELPRKATGQRTLAGRKIRATELSETQIAAVLAALPEWSIVGHGRHAKKPPYRVRDRFVFAYETGLRPSTLDRLSVPKNWRRGQVTLELDDDEDKARFGRTLPLSTTALEVLKRCAPSEGRIFPKHDFRGYLEKAASAVLPPDLAATFSQYDFRHARGTHLLEATGNLPGVGFLLGHKKATTTDKYSRASRRAAETVLGATRSLRVASGGTSGGKVLLARLKRVKRAVRRGGLEPPRCYPLAPQRTAIIGIIEEMRAFVQAIGSEQDKKHRAKNPSGGLPQYEFRIAFADEVAS